MDTPVKPLDQKAVVAGSGNDQRGQMVYQVVVRWYGEIEVAGCGRARVAPADRALLLEERIDVLGVADVGGGKDNGGLAWRSNLVFARPEEKRPDQKNDDAKSCSFHSLRSSVDSAAMYPKESRAARLSR